MIPPRFAKIAHSLIMSGLMSFLISGISSFRALGTGFDTVQAWLSGWPLTWAVAFPVVLVVSPLSHRIVKSLTRTP